MKKTSFVSRSSGDFSQQLRPMLEEAARLFRSVAQRSRFPYFHFCLRTIVGPGKPLQVLVDGGPPGFPDNVDLRSCQAQEALLAQAFAQVRPFAWRAADAVGAPARQDLRSMWARLGVEHGITVPLHGPGGAVGALSLGATDAITGNSQVLAALFQQTHWNALEAFDQINRAIRSEFDGNSRERPTSRQRQALALAAQGYPLFAIAEAMGVQPSTARYLISRATEKLGVRSREEAIVRITAMDSLCWDLYPRDVANQFVYFFTPADERSASAPKLLAA